MSQKQHQSVFRNLDAAGYLNGLTMTEAVQLRADPDSIRKAICGGAPASGTTMPQEQTDSGARTGEAKGLAVCKTRRRNSGIIRLGRGGAAELVAVTTEAFRTGNVCAGLSVGRNAIRIPEFRDALEGASLASKPVYTDPADRRGRLWKRSGWWCGARVRLLPGGSAALKLRRSAAL